MCRFEFVLLILMFDVFHFDYSDSVEHFFSSTAGTYLELINSVLSLYIDKKQHKMGTMCLSSTDICWLHYHKHGSIGSKFNMVSCGLSHCMVFTDCLT